MKPKRFFLISALSISLLLLGAILLLLGGQWRVTAIDEQSVYRTDSIPLNIAPVIEEMKPGSSLLIQSCFFDEDDVHLQVEPRAGGTGYVFDLRQHFSFDWSYGNIAPRLRTGELFYSLNCYRLAGQFGK